MSFALLPAFYIGKKVRKCREKSEELMENRTYTFLFLLVFTMALSGFNTPVFAKKSASAPKAEVNSLSPAGKNWPEVPATSPAAPQPSASPATTVGVAASSLSQTLSQGTAEEQKARAESFKRLAEALQKLAKQQQAQQVQPEAKSK